MLLLRRRVNSNYGILFMVTRWIAPDDDPPARWPSLVLHLKPIRNEWCRIATD